MELGSDLPAVDSASTANRAVCAHCGRENSVQDGYCTSCGAALPVGALASVPIEREQTLGSVTGLRRLTRVPPLAGFVALIAAVVLAALLALEFSHARRINNELASTRVSLQQTERHLVRTLHQLSSSTALSKRRRAVLLQAQTVLQKVNPLLSSVDGVQSQAQTLQGNADTLSSDAATFNQTVVTLINYLLQNDASSWDLSYVNTLIDDANSELDSVGSDEGEVSNADDTYNHASASFGNRADSFSSSVLALEKQLKSVTGH